MIGPARRLIVRTPRSAWLLGALAGGLLVGAWLGPSAARAIGAARLIGGLWLDTLRMTIVPLVFALVTTGVADLRSAGGGSIGRRLTLVLGGFLVVSALVAAALTPPLLHLVALPPGTLAGLEAQAPPDAAAAVPSTEEAIRALVPVNVVASAASGAMVPLVLFALVLGLALARIEPARARAMLEPLRGLADAMVVVVGWVLAVAPLGVFALALVIGATAGAGAALALGQYILAQVVVALALTAIPWAAASLIGRVPPWRFAAALWPAQAVAASTQSSIATLPAMLASAARIGVGERDAAVVLPLSVAVFKITAPSNAMLAGLTLAWLGGVQVHLAHVAVAVPLAVLATLAVLGMPGSVSFLAATAPTAVALGAPIGLLPILLAVDTIPDIFRTVANVTADIAAAAIVAPPAADPGVLPPPPDAGG